MSGAGRNHVAVRRLAEANERLRLVTTELRRAEAELDRYSTALQHIAYAESGLWGRVAYDALHPPSRAPPE